MNKDFFKIGKLSGRGTAAVLCLCLAAAAAAGIYNYNKSQLIAEKQITGTSDASAFSVADEKNENAVKAEAVQKNIPETTTSKAPEAQLPAQDLMPGNAEEVFADNTLSDEADPAEADVNDIPPEMISVGKNVASEASIMIRPLDGEIIEPFSNGELVKSKTLNVWKTHDGIDISGQIGESVRSACAGTVSAVYRDTMWGNCIEIEHSGGYKSFYFGLGDDISVSEGDSVNAGTVIGTVGESAECEASEDPHLHFALKKNGEWTDPAAAISGEGS